jgi:hypothetical protein
MPLCASRWQKLSIAQISQAGISLGKTALHLARRHVWNIKTRNNSHVATTDRMSLRVLSLFQNRWNNSAFEGLHKGRAFVAHGCTALGHQRSGRQTNKGQSQDNDANEMRHGVRVAPMGIGLNPPCPISPSLGNEWCIKGTKLARFSPQSTRFQGFNEGLTRYP